MVEIRAEDRVLLERDAWANHRSLREHAAYLLHLKIQELAQREAESGSADSSLESVA